MQTLSDLLITTIGDAHVHVHVSVRTNPILTVMAKQIEVKQSNAALFWLFIN